MKQIHIPHLPLWALVLPVGGLLGLLYAHLGHVTPRERSFTITAHKYAYDPPVLRVNRGDRLQIRLVAKDVTHGFFLEGYDVDARVRPENPTFWVRRPSGKADYKEVEEIKFVANRAGKFRYRCSITCGYMHPFMQGELIVSPNYLYSTSVGLSVALAVAMLLMFRRPPRGGRP